jgi:hypothetical protein
LRQFEEGIEDKQASKQAGASNEIVVDRQTDRDSHREKRKGRMNENDNTRTEG